MSRWGRNRCPAYQCSLLISSYRLPSSLGLTADITTFCYASQSCQLGISQCTASRSENVSVVCECLVMVTFLCLCMGALIWVSAKHCMLGFAVSLQWARAACPPNGRLPILPHSPSLTVADTPFTIHVRCLSKSSNHWHLS